MSLTGFDPPLVSYISFTIVKPYVFVLYSSSYSLVLIMYVLMYAVYYIGIIFIFLRIEFQFCSLQYR